MSTYRNQVGRGPCTAKCPQGNACACSDKAHDLHVCADATCACHQQERYRSEQRKMERRPAARRLVVFVWFWTEQRRAVWDGSRWIDHETGQVLPGVTHWQAIPPPTQ